MEKVKSSATKSIIVTEKVLLSIIAILTVVGTFQEIGKIFQKGSVELADLLLLFIYAEVLGMIGVFFSSNKIPITLPLFIAMTALARLIIMSAKDTEPIALIYESVSILIIAIAIVVLRVRHLDFFNRSKKN